MPAGTPGGHDGDGVARRHRAVDGDARARECKATALRAGGALKSADAPAEGGAREIPTLAARGRAQRRRRRIPCAGVARRGQRSRGGGRGRRRKQRVQRAPLPCRGERARGGGRPPCPFESRAERHFSAWGGAEGVGGTRGEATPYDAEKSLSRISLAGAHAAHSACEWQPWAHFRLAARRARRSGRQKESDVASPPLPLDEKQAPRSTRRRLPVQRSCAGCRGVQGGVGEPRGSESRARAPGQRGACAHRGRRRGASAARPLQTGPSHGKQRPQLDGGTLGQARTIPPSAIEAFDARTATEAAKGGRGERSSGVEDPRCVSGEARSVREREGGGRRRRQCHHGRVRARRREKRSDTSGDTTRQQARVTDSCQAVRLPRFPSPQNSQTVVRGLTTLISAGGRASEGGQGELRAT